MIHLHYCLNQENLKELNSYLAFHDKKMQKRILVILALLGVIIVVAGYLLFDLSFMMLLWSLIAIILSIFIIPKLYWNMVFKRVDYFVEKMAINYSDIDVVINQNIQVNEKSKKIEISFNDIVNFDYTKSNCILFYRDEEKINTLILPVSSFKEDELKKFHLYLTNRK